MHVAMCLPSKTSTKNQALMQCNQPLPHQVDAFVPLFYCSIGTMELFYTQVSEGMRSLGTSFYLLTMAIGTYLASALNIIVASASPVDLWVADNPLFGHYDWYFWCVAACYVTFVTLLQWLLRLHLVAAASWLDSSNKQQL
jgi:hypothetical protein